MGNIIPLNVPREVVVDTSLAGYHLPKVMRASQPQLFTLIFLNGGNLNLKSDVYSCPEESLKWGERCMMRDLIPGFILHVWSSEH